MAEIGVCAVRCQLPKALSVAYSDTRFLARIRRHQVVRQKFKFYFYVVITTLESSKILVTVAKS